MVSKPFYMKVYWNTKKILNKVSKNFLMCTNIINKAIDEHLKTFLVFKKNGIHTASSQDTVLTCKKITRQFMLVSK